MDNISNLSNNLPPTAPVSEVSLQEITTSLTNEFKNAAKSVSSLYKFSMQRNNMIRHQGYLDAINDLIQVLKNDGDVENWTRLKKLELEGTVKKEKEKEKETIETFEKLPSEYEFKIPGYQVQKFPCTSPLLSMYKRKKENQLQKEKESIRDSSDDEDQEFFLLENSNKRRYEILKASEKRSKC